MQPFGDSHRAHVALGLGGSSLQKRETWVSLLGRAGLEIPVHLADPLDGHVAEIAAHDAADAVHFAAETPGVVRVVRQREVHGVGWAGVAGVAGRVDGGEDGFLAVCVTHADL